ncbi:MAG: microcin C ABC transporter permease YejB [Neomegalonema sp.]|nr:microcin C ABC transporter permease YejB [Neomegalonema sp.]
MAAYLVRRILLIIPTLLGIMLLNFIVIQFAPGGPVEQVLAQLEQAGGATDRFTGGAGDAGAGGGGGDGNYRGRQGIDEAYIARLEQQFGLDKPAHERFWIMISNYARLDFGESFFKSKDVAELIWEKLPVSLTLGFWTFVLSYAISIPLGIRKAVKDGTPFDAWTSGVIIIGYAIPNFLFAILLLIFFAGGSYFQWFPLRGLNSTGWQEMSWGAYILDYLWHIVLPVLSLAVSGFATLTLLTKNSFLDEIKKQYVTTARAKGLTESRVLYGHVFRNAMLIVIAGIPAAVIGIFFGGSLLIETVFSLDGLGLLGYEAVLQRDYPVVFGTLFIFSLIALVSHILTDITYTLIDPRIDFGSRET